MSKASYIYFIKPSGMAGPIKIGCSFQPEERLASLSTWSPFELEIIATVEGGQKLERNIHECFADLHSHREWFHAGARLTDAIEKIKSGVPVECAIDLHKRIKSIRKGRCGGAAWSEVTRQKMSIFHRVRGAMKKTGGSPYRAPKPIDLIMRASGQRMLSQNELAIIARFTANPESFVPTPSHEGAAS